LLSKSQISMGRFLSDIFEIESTFTS